MQHQPVRGAADAAAGAGRLGPVPRGAPSREHRRRRAPPRHPGEIAPPGTNTAAGAGPRTLTTASKNLLTRNLETLSTDQFTKIIDTLDADAQGQQVAVTWIAKEKLRDALNLRARVTGSTPCERDVRGRLFKLYDWCARHHDIPELVSLAQTVSRWENQVVCAVLTGVTNAGSESLNRLAETRGQAGIRVPQPCQPAAPGPDRLHSHHAPEPAANTHRDQKPDANRNQPTPRTRLTTKAPLIRGETTARSAKTVFSPARRVSAVQRVACPAVARRH